MLEMVEVIKEDGSRKRFENTFAKEVRVQRKKTEGGIAYLVEISSKWGWRMHRRVEAVAWKREETRGKRRAEDRKAHSPFLSDIQW